LVRTPRSASHRDRPFESELRIKAIAEGYDPTTGIMHEASDRSSKFEFDLIEPKQPKMDRAVLDFPKSTVSDPADVVIRDDGVCRPNPEMTRMVRRVFLLLHDEKQMRIQGRKLARSSQLAEARIARVVAPD
jgi:CRISPR/Cas system-associated endonuclease Cas1